MSPKKIKNNDSVVPLQEVEFSETQPNPSRLLFICPLGNREFQESLYVLRQLEQRPDGGIFELAIPKIYQYTIPDPTPTTFYFPVAEHGPTGHLAEVLAARYRYSTFDAVVNLDPELTEEMAWVISTMRASMRIGAAHPKANDVYNIQIQRAETGTLRSLYNQILAFCDLGDIGEHPDYSGWG